jgi:aldose 1-epimerase
MNQPIATDFGTTPEGHAAPLYTLRNPHGLEARITNYGGILTHLMVPDPSGATADVVLGYDTLQPYTVDSPYFGALIGRVGNRIGEGCFTLDGDVYNLVTNSESHGIFCHLHGGTRGFDKVLWDADPGTINDQPCLRLRYLSPDGEEGYPGNLECVVTYTLTEDALRIDYEASGDKRTPVNLTNHTYFNLAGEGSGSILEHEATLQASHFTPVAPGMIPTGEIRSVVGTPFDFTSTKPFGRDMEADDEQIRLGGGFDHNFVIDADPLRDLTLAATVRDPRSGRVMETWTTEPGVQLYTGNSLDGTLTGKSGTPYDRWSAFCLETQHFPDAPNQPGFPSIILEPDQAYRSTTSYRFR